MKRNISRFFFAAVLATAFVTCNSGVEPFDPNNKPGTGPGNEPQKKTEWHTKAYETYNNLIGNYLVGSGKAKGLLNENSPKGKDDGVASFLWAYDGFISGVTALNKLGYDVDYVAKVDRFQSYFRSSGSVAVGGFGSSTDGQNGGGDRFYDDNSIVGIELVEAYKQTKDPKYLDWCAQIVRFLNTGKDDVFGGALWWCESYKNQPNNSDSNKPACSNGYATWFLLSYYEVCPEAEKAGVLAFAKELYTWLYNNLRDPEDNVYWNSKGADGSINRTKWTYNSGAMIAAGVRLHKITGEQDYIKQARLTADGAYNYFVRSRNGLNLCYPTNDPWFTIQLIKSYIEIEPFHPKVQSYLDVFEMYLEYAWEHGRSQNGLFYEDWTGVNINPDRDKSLLMQAAAVESLAVMALYKGEKK